MIGEEIRFSRLFGEGNAVVVAIDHGLYNGPLPGLVNLPQVITSITGADAILTSPGMVSHCRSVFMKRGAPALVVRLNWGTQYATQWEYNTAQSVRLISAQDAVALGADIALVGLSLKTGDEALDAHNIEILSAYVTEKHKVGIPLLQKICKNWSRLDAGSFLNWELMRSKPFLPENGLWRSHLLPPYRS